jgi:4a-hydroxytetrahydrobiopterin dehydratase
MSLLSHNQIEERLWALEGWRVDRNGIVKQFTFGNFPEAVAFVSRLVPGAEAADHHPDVAIAYKRVTLTYSTHSEGGLTDKDFDGAKMAEACAAASAS